MNHTQIEAALELHRKAFALLMECGSSGHAGSRPFDETTIAAWRDSESCRRWVTTHLDQLPVALRPESDQIALFAQLFSSLFATSFSISKSQIHGKTRMVVRALPTRHLDGSRKSAHAKSKEREVSNVLRRHALNLLLDQTEQSRLADSFLVIIADPASSTNLTLWTYAVQLVNRAEFASQGPAVYRLWLDLPEKTRRNLTADLVWQARQRLIDSLNSFQLTAIL